jgi:hypothetical protein
MAPEQRNGIAVDARADQYSFCVALTYALMATDAPKRVRDVVSHGLALDPRARFETMDDLLTALEAARPDVQPNRSRMRAWLAATAAAAVIVAVAVSAPSRSTPAAAAPLHAITPSDVVEPDVAGEIETELINRRPEPAPEPKPAPQIESEPAPTSAATPVKREVRRARSNKRARRDQPRRATTRRPEPDKLTDKQPQVTARRAEPDKLTDQQPRVTAHRPEPDGLIRDLWSSE